MTPQETKDKLKEKEEKYYNLSYYLMGVREHMLELKGYRSNSVAYKMLLLALNAMRNQVEEDYLVYKNIVDSKTYKETLKDMTKSYNREVIKNKALEKQIEEAKTSSGLFIDFVRDKLKLK